MGFATLKLRMTPVVRATRSPLRTVIIALAAVCALLVVPTSASASYSCGTRHIFRITGHITAAFISCRSARQVFVAVERAPLEAEVEETPYFEYSPPYDVDTPVGRFTCRREPFGLGGSEHNIRCSRGQQRVRWYTVHD
jgi:hypothetical protein